MESSLDELRTKQGWKLNPDAKQDPNAWYFAPEGHPRRCQSRIKRTNPPKQCRKWAMQDSEHCQFHGGRRHKISLGSKVRGHRLKMSLSRYVGPKLRETLLEASKAPVDARLSLLEEAEASRMLAGAVFKRLEALDIEIARREGEGQTEEGKEQLQRLRTARATAIGSAMEALRESTETVRRAAQVRAMFVGSVDHEHLGFIIAQVGIVIDEELKDHPEVARRVAERLAEVKLQIGAQAGAQSSADQAAALRRGLAAMETRTVGEVIEDATRVGNALPGAASS